MWHYQDVSAQMNQRYLQHEVIRTQNVNEVAAISVASIVISKSRPLVLINGC